jgi:RNA polymerase sigma factor (sigma-70 family)
MGIKDGTQPPQSTIILPLSVENRQLQLSINIDNADFFLEYTPLIIKCCKKMFHNKEDIEDMINDVFEYILKRKSKGSPIRYPAYLPLLVRNRGINKKKREARRELIEIYDMAANGSLKLIKEKGKQGQEIGEIGVIDKDHDQVEAEIIVKAILDKQDETTRKIYLYKYRHDMTLEQIGEAVGLKKSAVQKRIKNLEKQVRAETGKAGK